MSLRTRFLNTSLTEGIGTARRSGRIQGRKTEKYEMSLEQTSCGGTIRKEVLSVCLSSVYQSSAYHPAILKEDHRRLLLEELLTVKTRTI